MANGFEEVPMPRALEPDELQGLPAEYRHAARAARRANFGGMELQSANGHLLDQFIRDSVNHRTDQYGGSVASRTRLPLEVVAAVVGEWKARYPRATPAWSRLSRPMQPSTPATAAARSSTPAASLLASTPPLLRP